MIHALAWFIIFISPLLFIPWEFADHWLDFYWRFFLSQVVVILLFYFNYFYLIDRYLFNKQLKKFIFINVAAVLVSAAVVLLIDKVIFPMNLDLPKPPFKRRFGWVFGFSRDIILYLLTSALSVAIKMTGRWYQWDSERKELEKTHAEAELKNLKSQLNPHFLFNTLNNIYSLIGFSQERAQEAVHQLSKLLRYVLYDNNQTEVPVSQEIGFMQNYLDLVRLRFSSKVEIDFRVTGTHTELPVAPLLFVSLIENSFKHGVSTSEKSFVRIHLDLTVPDRLIFTSENSFFPKNEQDRSGSGIGLENLRKRLALIYREKATFIAEKREDTFFAEVIIRYA